MPQPQQVNTSKFTVLDVLYNHNDFSIALGTWVPTNSVSVAMRWNDAFDGNGYPKVFGNPQWFLISEDVAKSLLHGLLGNNLLSSHEYDAVLEALDKL